jgi:uncharacterized membrane protein required for colicin V production
VISIIKKINIFFMGIMITLLKFILKTFNWYDDIKDSVEWSEE